MQVDESPNATQRAGSTQRAAKDKARTLIAGVSKNSGAAKASAEEAEGMKELSMVTALRTLFRLLAAEQAQQAHKPLPRSVMMLLVTYLQPQCASAQKSEYSCARVCTRTHLRIFDL